MTYDLNACAHIHVRSYAGPAHTLASAYIYIISHRKCSSHEGLSAIQTLLAFDIPSVPTSTCVYCLHIYPVVDQEGSIIMLHANFQPVHIREY